MQQINLTPVFKAIATTIVFTSFNLSVNAQIIDHEIQSSDNTLSTWVKGATKCQQATFAAPAYIVPSSSAPTRGLVVVDYAVQLSGNCQAHKRTYRFAGYRYEVDTPTPEIPSWLMPVSSDASKPIDFEGVCQKLKQFADTKIGLNRTRDFCAAAVKQNPTDIALLYAAAEGLTLNDEVRNRAEATTAVQWLETIIKSPRPTLLDNDTDAAYSDKLRTMYIQDQAKRRLSQLHIVGIVDPTADEKTREDGAIKYSRTDPSFLEWYGRFLLLRAQANSKDAVKGQELIESTLGARAGPAARMVGQLHEKGQSQFTKNTVQALGWYKYSALTGSDAAWRIIPTLPKISAQDNTDANALCVELFARFKPEHISIRKSETVPAIVSPVGNIAQQCANVQ